MSKWKIRMDEDGFPVRPAADESSVGLTVVVSGWGGSIRVTDVGITGTVVGVGRTRLKVEVTKGAAGVHVGDVFPVGSMFLQILDEMPDDWDPVAEQKAEQEARAKRTREVIARRESLLTAWREVQSLIAAAETDVERIALEIRADEIDAELAETFS
mgnify:CR=1 FL=1